MAVQKGEPLESTGTLMCLKSYYRGLLKLYLNNSDDIKSHYPGQHTLDTLLCDRYCSKYLTCIELFNPDNIPTELELSLSYFSDEETET